MNTTKEVIAAVIYIADIGIERLERQALAGLSHSARIAEDAIELRRYIKNVRKDLEKAQGMEDFATSIIEAQAQDPPG
jgi:hypothetical protein